MSKSLDIYRKIIPSLHQLNWHALQYALYCAVLAEKRMRRGEVKIKHTSYPACVACFQSDICSNIGYGYSGQYKLEPSSFRHPLHIMLKNLGKIGEKSYVSGSTNLIGKCAEVSAVNTFLYECEKCHRNNTHMYYPYGCGRDYVESMINTKGFMLSEAFRPRTLEHIERCDNCKKIFGTNY